MDIIYILGTGSKWQNNEIRYSIRSVLKHCQDLERVIIIGEDPGFYQYNDKLIHIQAADTAHKEANIWKKVLKAAGTPEISDPFLFINDDHFMLKPFNAAVYPYYTKGDLAEMNFNTLDSYQMILKATRQALQKRGLPTYHFDIHTPMLIHKAAFIEVFSAFEEEVMTVPGLVMKSCYANYWRKQPEFLNDLKLKRGCSFTELAEIHHRRHVISVADEALTRNFRQWLEFHFPKPHPSEIRSR
jgi:hypothetical protein